MARLRALTALIAVAFVISGCTQAAPQDSGVSPSTTENGIRSLSASEIVVTARRNAEAQTSVHLRGRGSCPLGQFFVDLRLRNDGKGAGTVRFFPYTVQLISTPESLYVQGDAGFWLQQTDEVTAKKLGGRWLRVAPATNPCLAALGSMRTVLENYLTSSTVPVKENSHAVFGVPAQLVTLPPTTSLWVKTTGLALPIQIDDPPNKVQLALGEWGEEVTVDVPPANEIIDASTVSGLG